MKFGELLEHCIEIIETFNPKIMTLDSYAEEYTKKVSFI